KSGRDPNSSLRTRLQRRGDRENPGPIARFHRRDVVSGARAPQETSGRDVMNDNIHQTLKHDLPSAPKEEMERDVARVLNRLRSEGNGAARQPVDERIAAFERTMSSTRWRRFAAIPAAAAIL